MFEVLAISSMKEVCDQYRSQNLDPLADAKNDALIKRLLEAHNQKCCNNAQQVSIVNKRMCSEFR